VSKQHLRILAHDSACEGISLIWSKVMTIIPATTSQLFEIRARVNGFVLGGQVVENLGRSVNT
jgi:hypothetical protein